MNAAVSEFEPQDAVREADGLLIGIVGPSSSGKTYSALRLAKGIQRVVGGDIGVIDTENGRAKHYADRFRFKHVKFRAPFSPLRYLEAIRVSARSVKTIVVDSTSHEHEGAGGVLEWHEAEVQRLSGGDPEKAERVKMLAWAKPKAARRKLINEMLQMNVNLILTFRAKEKLKIMRGKEPIELGWQPIAGDEFIYEMVLQCLLKPNSRGVPTWKSHLEGENAIIKVPEQFLDLFGKTEPLTEEHGQKLAEWAAGGVKLNPEVSALLADYLKCTDEAAFAALEKRRNELWAKQLPAGCKPRLKEASDTARKRLDELTKSTAGNAPSPAAPDDAVWIARFREQTSSAGLGQARTECLEAYNDRIPLPVDDAYQMARERIEEQEGKQLEL
jgi:hypothetical protein